jgi:putative transposase
MKGKTHSTEEIIRILQQADGGQIAQAVCREHNISEQTFYCWKKKYGGIALAEAMLGNRVLQEVNAKKW